MAAKMKVDYDYIKETQMGTELVSVGRLETKDEYLLDILKEHGFYLLHETKETKFGNHESYKILYPKED